MKDTEIIEINPSITTPSKNQKKADNGTYFVFPNSPASNQVMNVVSHVDNMESFADRIESNNHSTQIDFYAPPEGKELSQRIKYHTENTETTVHLDNVDIFSKSKKPLKKILTYTLIQLSKENVEENLNNDLCIHFPLQEFVDLGCYKTISTARQAFNQAKSPLTSIKIEGVVRDKKDMKQITDNGIEVLFTGAHIKKGIVEIYLNKRINWKLFALQYFSILPKSYFSISDNAADILLNIFMLARKRLNDIQDKNHFNVSFRTLQQVLDLPDETKTKNPGRDIQNAILDAIEEVNNAESEDLHVEPVYNKNGNIIEFLDKGYAEITMYNEYENYFMDLAQTKTEKIEQSQKRHAQIVSGMTKNEEEKGKNEKQKNEAGTGADIGEGLDADTDGED